LDPKIQRKEFLTMLDKHQQIGMNAVVVQVRPCGDAMYPSKYAPWSEYLSGEQGKAPEPFYDPTAFMINAAHERNMEFHAWFNPFRAVSHNKFSSVIDSNIVHRKPEWVMKNGKQLYLNPGIPEVRDYVVQVMLEVAKTYDIDGIHFDDYFYPYPDAEAPFDDAATFATYGKGATDRNAWRRDNIDRFIEQLHDSLQYIKPHLKFGVSPVGIWRNKSDDERGSNTRIGYTSYDLLYADVRKWLQNGWVDYVAPQLYWAASNPRARYDELLPWWVANSFGRHLYIGQAAYKVKEGHSKQWRSTEHLPLQLRMNQAYPEIQGSIFYSARSFDNNPYQLVEKLRDEHYRYPSLIPAMRWKDSIPPLEPQKLELAVQEGKVHLSWEAPKPASDGEGAAYYVVYRFKGKSQADLSQAENILAVSQKPGWIDTEPMENDDYLYLVTSVDRLHNESQTCAAILLPVRTQANLEIAK
jgi:uncharacterized lipoprotein YddW (UPF0748 family)